MDWQIGKWHDERQRWDEVCTSLKVIMREITKPRRARMAALRAASAAD